MGSSPSSAEPRDAAEWREGDLLRGQLAHALDRTIDQVSVSALIAINTLDFQLGCIPDRVGGGSKASRSVAERLSHQRDCKSPGSSTLSGVWQSIGRARSSSARQSRNRLVSFSERLLVL